MFDTQWPRVFDLRGLINLTYVSALTILFAVILLLSVLYILRYNRYPRIIKLESTYKSLLWTWRLMNATISFAETLEDWSHEPEVTTERMISVQRTWLFLHSFFASRGYTMYRRHPTAFGDLVPAPFPPVAKNVTYPYARQIPSNELEPMMAWSIRIWAARDALGRDVIIKVISEVDNPSQELKVMQRLNSEKLRSDLANHTIYALEYLTFDKFVFVVMPRWDNAFLPDFAIVSELVSFALTCFQTSDFLHHNRIVHLDFLPQHIGMNAVMKYSEMLHSMGMWDPEEVRYALFDFGAFIAFPEDAVIEETLTTHYLSFDLYDVPEKSVKYPYNPFKANIAFLGTYLQRRIRHIENLVPELGPFLKSLVDMNDPNPFSATQALARFT